MFEGKDDELYESVAFGEVELFDDEDELYEGVAFGEVVLFDDEDMFNFFYIYLKHKNENQVVI